MPAIEDSGLDPLGRALLERSIAAEPGLRPELELIVDALDDQARSQFWRSLARISAGRRSVASAVLEALSEAARERR